MFSGESPAQDGHVEARADGEGVGLALRRVGRNDAADAENRSSECFWELDFGGSLFGRLILNI